jgi:hypothetical protein
MAERNLSLWRDMQQDLLRTFIAPPGTAVRKDDNES